jgi:hypothetical protein
MSGETKPATVFSTAIPPQDEIKAVLGAVRHWIREEHEAGSL